MYLQISLSAFFTVFAARTRGFFWERRPGRALLTAAVGSTGLSTILSSFWPLAFSNPVPKDRPDMKYAVMTGLQHQGLAILLVWCYALLLFVVMDCFKVLTYYILKLVWRTDEDRIETVSGRAAVTTALANESRRRHHGPSKPATSRQIGRAHV